MLTVLLISLVVLMGACLLLLFLPMRVIIDTTSGTYRLQWGPANASLYFTQNDVRYRVRAPFFTKDEAVSGLWTGSSSERTGRGREQAVGRSWRPSFKELLRTFRVRRFRWVMDTGDPLWNAWLYPAFHLLQRHGHDVSISFIGRNELQLDVSNNLYRLLKTVLLSTPTKQRQP